MNNQLIKQFVNLRPTGGFRVILADPAVSFDNWSAKGEAKNAKAHYDCMSFEQIAKMPVGALCADDCVLFLWVTWPTMPHWQEMITGWGFTFAGLAWEWRKYNPETGKSALPDDLFGMGRAPAGVHSVRDWIEWWPEDEIRAPRREHSRKPDEQYGRIETMFDGPYLELFARQKRKGWSVWGNQTDKFGEVA